MEKELGKVVIFIIISIIFSIIYTTYIKRNKNINIEIISNDSVIVNNAIVTE